MIIWVLFVSSSELTAQVIQARVQFPDNQTRSTTLSVFDSVTNTLKEFHISKIPEFSYRLKSSYNTIYIQFKSFGYSSEKIYLQVGDTSKIYNVGNVQMLKERVEILDEVAVIAAPVAVRDRNDTTFYSIAKFIDSTERNVEDILKKLPGLEVDAAGNVKFRGSTVTRLLIEGEDIFKNKYTDGTRNIPAAAVKDIEVVHEYSSNPVLGKLKSDGIAINLRIKDSFQKVTGKAEASVGLDDQPELRKQLQSNVLGITKKHQFNLNLSHNNIGQSDYIQSGGGDLVNNNILKSPLIGNISLPSGNRQVENNQSKMILNGSFKLSSKLVLKVIGSFGRDHLAHQQSISSANYIQGDTIQYKDIFTKNRKVSVNRIHAELAYTIKPNARVLYTISTQRDINKMPFSTLKNEIDTFNIRQRNDQEYIIQYLEYTQRFKKFALEVYTRYTYQDLDQSISFEQMMFGSSSGTNILQRSNDRFKRWENSAKIYYQEKNTTINTSLKYVKLDNPFEFNRTDLPTYESVLFYNDALEWNTQFNHKWNYYQFEFAYKMDGQFPRLQTNKEHEKLRDFYLFHGLNGRVIYKKNQKTFSLQIRQEQEFTLDRYRYPIDYLVDHRNSIQSNVLDKTIQHQQIALGANSNISSKNISYWGLYRYERVKGGVFGDLLITQDRYATQWIFFEDVLQSHAFNLFGSKFFYKLSTTIQLGYQVSYLQSNNRINGVISPQNYLNQNSQLKLSTNFLKIPNLIITLNRTDQQNRLKGFASSKIISWNNIYELNKIFHKRVVAKLQWYHVVPDTKRMEYATHFLDGSLSYRPKKTKFEYGISGLNLLNLKKMEQVRVTAYSYQYQSFQFLPRMILFKISYQFL